MQLLAKMSKAVRKVLDESRETGNPELDLQDKQITTLDELPGLSEWRGGAGAQLRPRPHTPNTSCTCLIIMIYLLYIFVIVYFLVIHFHSLCMCHFFFYYSLLTRNTFSCNTSCQGSRVSGWPRHSPTAQLYLPRVLTCPAISASVVECQDPGALGVGCRGPPWRPHSHRDIILNSYSSPHVLPCGLMSTVCTQ